MARSRTKSRQRSTRNTGKQSDPQAAARASAVHNGLVPPATPPATPQPTQAVQTNTNQERGIRMALTTEQIAQLLANTRTKGQYTGFLNQFLESGEQGVCANDEWMEIKDKKASTIKQGFVNAIDKKDAHEDAQYVKVLVNEEKVYLINVKAAGLDVETEPELEENAA